MKKQNRKWFSRILPLTLIALALCCMGVGVDDKIRLNDENKKHIEFAVRMFRELTPKPGKPALFSPYCLEMNLAILAKGSAGETRKQFEAITAVNDFERQQNLFRQFRHYNGIVKVNNYLEYDSSAIQLGQSYLSQIQKNGFCQVASGGGGMNDSDIFKLISLLKFNDEWKTPFEPENIEKDFYQTPYTLPVKCMMMAMNETSLYSHKDEHWESVLLPFRNSDFQMMLLKPREIIYHEELASYLSADTIVTHLNESWPRSFYVRIPKFKFENELDMLAILQKLGVRLNEEANFSNMYEQIERSKGSSKSMNNTNEMYIGTLSQKNLFEVNEVRARGESRTVATGFNVGCSAGMSLPGKYFIADRPFIFVLLHKPSKTVLFIGSFDLNAQGLTK